MSHQLLRPPDAPVIDVLQWRDMVGQPEGAMKMRNRASDERSQICDADPAGQMRLDVVVQLLHLPAREAVGCLILPPQCIRASTKGIRGYAMISRRTFVKGIATATATFPLLPASAPSSSRGRPC